MTRRLPFALLGALAALLMAAGHPAGATAAPAATSHAAVGTGHVADGVLTLAHPRTVAPLPPAVPSAAPRVGDPQTAPVAAIAPPPGKSLAGVPPAAIRGPPA